MNHWMSEETERRLLADDPTLTSVSLEVHAESDASSTVAVAAPPTLAVADVERITAALCQSTHVTDLTLSFKLFDSIVERLLGQVAEIWGNGGDVFAAFAGTAVAKMADWMLTNTRLRTVCFSSCPRLRWLSGCLLLPRFLQQISLRPSSGRPALTKVSLRLLHVEADSLVALIRDAQLKDFSMHRCMIGHDRSFRNEELAARRVGESFATNSTLSKLFLGVGSINEVYYAAILGALQSSTTSKITSLGLCHHSLTMPAATAAAIADVFKSSTLPLKLIRFDHFDWTEELMAPIAQSIKASPMPIEGIMLCHGSLDSAACGHLQSIFSSSSDEGGNKIRTLWLTQGVEFPNDNNHQAIQELVGQSPGLRSLCLPDFDDDNIGGRTEHETTTTTGASTAKQQREARFAALVRGLLAPSCAVERLIINTLGSAYLEQLLQGIPQFRSVKFICFDVPRLPSQSLTIKKKLMKAFRRNRSLLFSNINCHEDVLNASDRALLDVYHKRNRSLKTVIRSQATVGIRRRGNGGTLLPRLFAVSDSTVMQATSFVLDGLVCMADQAGPETTRCSVKRTCQSPDSESSKRRKVDV